MKFQYYWDHGFPPTPKGFGATSASSDNTDGGDAMGSAVDRIKSKALQAKGVVPRVLASVESGLDGIIAAESDLEKQKEAALAPHLSAIADTKTELDGIKSALDILSNGGPPLQASTTALPSSAGSTPVVHPVDHATGDPLKT